MGLFQIKRTFVDASSSQSGFAEPGYGAQGAGVPSYNSDPTDERPIRPERPTKGILSWLFDDPESRQRGYPEPEMYLQHRPPGSMPNKPWQWGGVYQKYTPPYSRGAAAYAPNFGKIVENPIGAGIYTAHRPRSSYGAPAVFVNGIAFWAPQVIPTSVHLQGLTTAEEMDALLGTVDVQAAVRVA